VPKTIKLPESSSEWLRAETASEVVEELYSRFDSAVMVEATKDSLYITEANTPMIFLRYMPSDDDTKPVPF
jgi:hypothetical protein